MSLVFFYAPWSTASTIHSVLEELEVPYEKERLDLAKRDQDAPRFRALNPNGKVPVVVHDGVAIFESAAIAAYLGETFGVERGLYPAAGPARGRALAWLSWTSVTLGGAFSRQLHHTGKDVPEDERNAKAGERARAEVATHLGILDATLKAHPWVLGESFSLVDAYLASLVGWMAFAGADLAPFASVTAWLGRAQARPACARARATEG